jgi:hypothetical protein
MRVRLTRKLAECVDGVDLSEHREGDVLTLSAGEAELLIAEGWAVRVAHRSGADVRDRSLATPNPAQAADRLQARVSRRAAVRVHDELRDELHDVHARIVTPAAVPRRER